MKLYCLDYDNCGYYEVVDREVVDDDLICPYCYGLVLLYENHTRPDWLLDILPSGSFEEEE